MSLIYIILIASHHLLSRTTHLLLASAFSRTYLCMQTFYVSRRCRFHHTHFDKDNINIPINSNKFPEDVMQRRSRIQLGEYLKHFRLIVQLFLKFFCTQRSPICDFGIMQYTNKKKFSAFASTLCKGSRIFMTRVERAQHRT